MDRFESITSYLSTFDIRVNIMENIANQEQWLAGEREPKLLFKYKKIATVLDLSRLVYSIKHNKIYLPEASNLNDSLEGMGTVLVGDMLENEQQVRDKFRILALSESCFSPVMWSHYADNRRGICLCFKKGNRFDINNTSAFKEAERIDYVTERNMFSSDTYQAIRDNLNCKNNDWSYEREWRIIKETTDEYMCYNSNDLACIIFGEKTDEMSKELIKNTFPHIAFYSIESDPQKYRLVMRNLVTHISIDSVEALFNDINT